MVGTFQYSVTSCTSASLEDTTALLLLAGPDDAELDGLLDQEDIVELCANLAANFEHKPLYVLGAPWVDVWEIMLQASAGDDVAVDHMPNLEW